MVGTGLTPVADVLENKIAFRRKKRVIDLTTARIMAKGLEEAKIDCLREERVCTTLSLSLFLPL
jgi:hypothetical protein